MSSDDLVGFLDVERRARVPSDEPEISVQKTGSIGVNPAAVKALGKPARVHLKYRPDPPAIAIMAAGEADRTAYALQENGSSAVINAKQVIGLLKLDLPRVTRFPARVIDGPGLVIDLSGGPEWHARQQ